DLSSGVVRRRYRFADQPRYPGSGPSFEYLQACADFQGRGRRAAAVRASSLLVAPDGSKLSKRRHGPVVSVTTYRDAGFLPEAFINFLCLLGWSPKDDREKMTRQEVVDA